MGNNYCLALSLIKIQKIKGIVMAFSIAYSKRNNIQYSIASLCHSYLRLKFLYPNILASALRASIISFCLCFIYIPNLYAADEPSGFNIQSLETLMRDRVYLLNVNFNYDFSSEAIEALEHGVPLLILVDIEILSPRWWWGDKTIANLEQGYLLLYHALSESYVVHNLNSGTQNNFVSLQQSLSFLSQIKELPILDANLLDSKKDYYLRVRTHLDIESLPAPMRPLAYISNDWQLSSDWYEWPLQK